MVKLLKQSTVAGLALLASQQAFAVTINVDYVRGLANGFSGSAYDASSGKYYEKRGYTGTTQLHVYNNKADYESGVVANTVAFQDNTHGTYFEVTNGKMYSRTDNVSGSASVWDINSGLKDVTTSFATMGGANSVHTFNWGGYSGVNFMEDQGNVYLMGKNANGAGWQINQADSNLNVLSTTQYSAGTLGYSFIINGVLFSSMSFNSNYINHAVNLSTGVEMAVDFTLNGFGNLYMTNVNYNSVDDTLYFHNNNGRHLMKLDNASSAFGVPLASVPAPAGLVLMLTGLAGITAMRRRLPQALS